MRRRRRLPRWKHPTNRPQINPMVRNVNLRQKPISLCGAHLKKSRNSFALTHEHPDRLRSVVVGIGSYLPNRIVSNQDLEKSLDTTDEWIVQRTGIKQRHIAGEEERTSTLGFGLPRRLSPMPG